MAVKKTDIVVSAVAPAGILIGGANLVQWLTGLTGHPMDGETAYTVVSSLYAGALGLMTWLKSKK